VRARTILEDARRRQFFLRPASQASPSSDVGRSLRPASVAIRGLRRKICAERSTESDTLDQRGPMRAVRLAHWHQPDLTPDRCLKIVYGVGRWAKR
jgi:hypothetical protein